MKKSSQSRRKSIAATSQNKPPVPKPRRRPHSIVPGARLSPLSKARRSLAPRKSILKAALNFPTPDDTQSEAQSQSVLQLPPPLKPHTSLIDDTDPTTSIDITRDFHTEIHDNTTRKSLGRRVSFATHAQVRLFESVEGNTNSTASPQSSPTVASTDDEGQEASPVNMPKVVTDENAYPGALPLNRRRSLVRHSVGGGEESMDVDMNDTARGPFAFLRASTASDSAIQDDDDEDEGSYDGEMEMTEALRENLIRRRSLAAAAAHRRTPSVVPPPTASDPPEEDTSYNEDADESQQSYTDDNSTRSSGDTSLPAKQPVEYTIPLSKPLRPPAPPDELWLALRKMTHSGDTPYEPPVSSDDEARDDGDGMDLDHAVERLMHARSSLPSFENSQEPGDDSFSSIDNSYDENADLGDRTMDVSKVFGKFNTGDQSAMNMTIDATSAVSETSVPHQAAPLTPAQTRIESTPAPTRSSVFQPPLSEVFQPPLQPNNSAPSTGASSDRDPAQESVSRLPFSFSPKSTSTAPPTPNKTTSPSKTNSLSTRFLGPQVKSKPPPSATPPAFRPSPKKRPNPSVGDENGIPDADRPNPAKRVALAPPATRPSPKKRPNPSVGNENGTPDGERPNPAKRMALAGKWTATVSTATSTGDSVSATNPKPLSPSKKAFFQSSRQEPPPPPPTSSLRRPSGYFSRRKSMGVESSTVGGEAAKGGAANAPSTKAGPGIGRASVGSVVLGLTNDLSRVQGKGKTSQSVADGGRQTVTAPSTTHDTHNSRERSSAQNRTSPTVSAVDNSGVREESEDDEINARDVQAGMTMNLTELWRDNVQQHDFAADDVGPPISIEQFFAITGIRFMDDITVPRQSVHPSQLRPNSRTRRRSSEQAPEIPLAEYVTAMAVDVPQLKLYTRVSKDLQAWIAQSKVVYDQAEEEAAKLTPELFTEYSQADEEGQEQLLHQLHLMKAHSRGLAKSDWYDWKLGWVEGLYTAANKGFAELEADAKELEKINNLAMEILPGLEEEHEQVMRELEQEQADVAEIESCDKDYLSELKASITEQNLEVEALRAEVIESKSQIEWLEERIAESKSQKQEAAAVISEANRLVQIQKSSTSAEVFRLKDRLETLETLHMFRVTSVNENLFEFVYASQFRVSLPCVKFRPRVEKVDIRRVDSTESKSKDAYPHLSDLFLRTARERVTRKGDLSTIQIAQYLGDYWSSCSQLRCQLSLLAVKYPLSIEIIPPGTSGFKAKAVVLFPNTRGKAVISFAFDEECFSLWPATIGSVKCEVKIAYGPLDPERIYKAVAARLAEASADDNHACLLDACIGAMDGYR